MKDAAKHAVECLILVLGFLLLLAVTPFVVAIGAVLILGAFTWRVAENVLGFTLFLVVVALIVLASPIILPLVIIANCFGGVEVKGDGGSSISQNIEADINGNYIVHNRVVRYESRS